MSVGKGWLGLTSSSKSQASSWEVSWVSQAAGVKPRPWPVKVCIAARSCQVVCLAMQVASPPSAYVQRRRSSFAPEKPSSPGPMGSAQTVTGTPLPIRWEN